MICGPGRVVGCRGQVNVPLGQVEYYNQDDLPLVFTSAGQAGAKIYGVHSTPSTSGSAASPAVLVSCARPRHREPISSPKYPLHLNHAILLKLFWSLQG